MGRQYKIRVIRGGKDIVYGVAIPNELVHWSNTLVTISESGGALILASGARPQSLTRKQIISQSRKIEVISL